MEKPKSKKAFTHIPRVIRAALFYLIQWTWGLPQNLAGLAVLLLMGRQRRERYHGAVVTLFEENRVMGDHGAVSLGMFIFIPLCWGEAQCRQTAVHEYGHTVQSLVLGPAYLIAVGIPSITWARRWGRSQMTPMPDGVTISQLEEGAPTRSQASPALAKLPKKLRRRLKLKTVRYTSRYPENWANILGEYATGEEPSWH